MPLVQPLYSQVRSVIPRDMKTHSTLSECACVSFFIFHCLKTLLIISEPQFSLQIGDTDTDMEKYL